MWLLLALRNYLSIFMKCRRHRFTRDRHSHRPAYHADTRVSCFMLSNTLGSLSGLLAKLPNPNWHPDV